MMSAAFIVYLVIGVVLYVKQRSFVFIPPQETQDDNVRSFRFTTDDGVDLKIWLLNRENDNAIIYFGGNAEDPWYNHEAFSAIFPNHTIYLMNYRGYAGSAGSPSESALYNDALQLFDAVQNRHQNVSVIGRSLGSALATRVGAEREVDRVALITPFDSLENIAKAQYPFYPIGLMLKDKFHSYIDAAEITAPTLVIMAENDLIVPKIYTDRLIASFTISNVQINTINDVNHNTITIEVLYTNLLREFFNKT